LKLAIRLALLAAPILAGVVVYDSWWMPILGAVGPNDVPGRYVKGDEELTLRPDGTYSYVLPRPQNQLVPHELLREDGHWSVIVTDDSVQRVHLSVGKQFGDETLSIVNRQGPDVRILRSVFGAKMVLGWDSDSRWFMARNDP